MTDDLHNDPIRKSAEEFSLSPSPRVWENVDRAINGKERKRRLIIFFFCGLLAAGIAGAWMITRSDKDIMADAASENSPVNVPPADAESSPSDAMLLPETASTGEEQMASTAQSADTDLNVTPPFENEQGPYAGNERPVAVDRAGVNDVPAKDTYVQLPEKENVLPASPVDILPDTVVAKDPVHSGDTLLPVDTIHVVKIDSQQMNVPVVPLPVAVEEPEKDTVDPSALHRFSIAFSAAPAISFTQIEEVNTHAIRDYRMNTDRLRPSLNAHLHLHFAVTPRLEMYSGINVTSFSNFIRSQQIVYRYDTGPVSGPSPPPVVVREENYTIDPDKHEVANRITYLGVPLGVRFNVLPRQRFHLWICGEAAFHRMIQARGYLYDDNQGIYRSMQKADLQQTQLSYGFGLAAQWRMTDHLQAEVSPVFRIYSGNMLASGILTQQFSQAEVRLSLRYSFARL